MSYKTLKSIYYEDKSKYNDEKNNRYNSISSVKLPLKIHNNPSFFIYTPEIVIKINSIFSGLSTLTTAYSEVPIVAQSRYFQSCLFDEIKNSNDIEGVQSTRLQIKNAYEQIKQNGDKSKEIRFSGIVNKYNKIIAGEKIQLESSKDIRDLYNDIILPEIPKEYYPDGKYFRLEPVSIVAASQKEKHRGILGEENIIEAVDTALSILSMRIIPHIIQIAIVHYYIGYIHPFYDGNGRLARFISSYLLANSIDPLISYRLSYFIKNNRSTYYKAFDECNDKKNAGDVTPFILYFLDLISDSIKNIVEKVKDGTAELKKYSALIDKMNLSNEDSDIIFLLVQNKLFSYDPFNAAELAKIVCKTSGTITRHMNRLKNEGHPIIVIKSGRRNLYTIDLSKFTPNN